MREVKSDSKPLVSTNFIDRAFNYINPVAGARRLHARAMIGMATGGYKGASKSRRSLSGWVTKLIGGSADNDTLADLPTLRERSRDLVRNSPIATGAVSGTTLKVVGRGLRVQSKINAEYLGLNEEQARAWQTAAEFEFNTWAGTNSSLKECSISHDMNFAEIQALAFRSTLESGDNFPVLHRVDGTRQLPYKTCIQLVEADRISNNKGLRDKMLEGGGSLVAGIEKDKHGRAVKYHILRGHPGNTQLYSIKNRTWDIIPAVGSLTGRHNVLHLLTRLRPDQTRGVPFLAPVIETLKQLDRYTEAEIMAAVVSGLFTVFVESDGQGLSPLDSASTGNAPGSSGDSRDTNWNGELSSGLVVDLNKGEKISTADPGRPNTAFDAFVLSVMRQVGVALDIPFEVLFKHFQSSYSASRAALLEAWTFYRARRFWLAGNLCQPVYEAVIEEAVLLGRLHAPGFLQDPFIRAAYFKSVWTGDGMGSIDPYKDAQAAEKNMLIGRTTLEDEVMAYDGGDYEDKIKQAGREKKLKIANGVYIEPNPNTNSETETTNEDDVDEK